MSSPASYNWRWRSHAVRLRPFPEATATRSLAGLIKTCGGRLNRISLSAARSHRVKRTIDLDSHVPCRFLCSRGRGIWMCEHGGLAVSEAAKELHDRTDAPLSGALAHVSSI